MRRSVVSCPSQMHLNSKKFQLPGCTAQLASRLAGAVNRLRYLVLSRIAVVCFGFSVVDEMTMRPRVWFNSNETAIVAQSFGNDARRSAKSAAKFDDGISVSDQSSCKDPLIPLRATEESAFVRGARPKLAIKFVVACSLRCRRCKGLPAEVWRWQENDRVHCTPKPLIIHGPSGPRDGFLT